MIGNGNVALDVARMLSKHADDLLVTEIPENVYEGLKASPVTDVHIFGRRGPAQVKFTPLELRELSHSQGCGHGPLSGGLRVRRGLGWGDPDNNQTKTMVNTLTNWLVEEPRRRPPASRRLHLHFLHSPVEITGTDGKVSGIRFERMKLDGTGRPRHRRDRGVPGAGGLPGRRLLRFGAAGGRASRAARRDPERGRPGAGRRRATPCRGSTPRAGSSAVRWA